MNQHPLFTRLMNFGRPKPKPRPEGPNYADLYVRAIAACVDISLLYALLAKPFSTVAESLYLHVDKPLMAKAGASNDNMEILSLMWQAHLPQLWLLNAALQVICIGVVMVGIQCLYRTTPGKWLLALRVLDAKTMQPPARWRYILRYLAYIPAILPFMLGIFWVNFNPRHRGWHDMIAGTVVVHRYPRGWVWQQVKLGAKRLTQRLRQKSEK